MMSDCVPKPNRQPPSKMDREEFIEFFGSAYEKSPWIAGQAWDEGLTHAEDTPVGLSRAFVGIVDDAGPEAQLVLLCAHPDLAGRLATRDELTTASQVEQASAGLDQCTEDEFAEFQLLNQSYTSKFGFPFIRAVRGHTRHQILENFRDRIENDREDEFAEALRQVHRIARLRLQQIDF